MCGINRMFLVGYLKAVEASPLLEWEVKLIGVPELEDGDVVFGVAEVG